MSDEINSQALDNELEPWQRLAAEGLSRIEEDAVMPSLEFEMRSMAPEVAEEIWQVLKDDHPDMVLRVRLIIERALIEARKAAEKANG